MAARASTSNLGLTGIPLFIAIELLLYGRGEQSHQEEMMHLGKAYGWLRAYLPVLYEKKPEELTRERIPVLDKDGNLVLLSINAMMCEAAIEIAAMYEKYQPAYEGQKSCSDSEKKFIGTMRAVFERLATVVAFSGIVDKISNTDEVFF